MKQTVTVTTDFGDQFATSQLRAVMATLGFDGIVIENHSVTFPSITEGAFEIKILARYSPDNSVHVGVIDPGVGSARRGIVIQTKKAYFIGPDNGLFFPVAQEQGIEKVWQLVENHVSDQISNTFHGRDVFIKAGVFLGMGQKPEDFGSIPVETSSLVPFSFKQGQIVHVDNYGNIKVNWQGELKLGQKLKVTSRKGTFEVPVVKTFSEVSPNMPVALMGSSGTLELAVNLGRGDTFYGVKLEDVLTIEQI